jgi:hypothetical protein
MDPLNLGLALWWKRTFARGPFSFLFSTEHAAPNRLEFKLSFFYLPLLIQTCAACPPGAAP